MPKMGPPPPRSMDALHRVRNEDKGGAHRSGMRGPFGHQRQQVRKGYGHRQSHNCFHATICGGVSNENLVTTEWGTADAAAAAAGDVRPLTDSGGSGSVEEAGRAWWWIERRAYHRLTRGQ